MPVKTVLRCRNPLVQLILVKEIFKGKNGNYEDENTKGMVGGPRDRKINRENDSKRESISTELLG